ncbi:hypothetical protein GCM10023310_59260 [Paenibacillus vulneris]|uniref:DUF6115 domain-containing protein n=1 Tax=Paenibacillus vulneris TaxID=1133364 RepID=A0ABW3V0C6_9BACL|nr:hypothetical protein [Paenibacillus sp. OAS669]MBE1446430.1 archaellum component FlaC [Paenibacillus sp. OAS669]
MYQPWVYIVLVGLVFIVYATLVPKTNTSNGKSSPSINEIEQTMEHFAGELEEQNEALIRQLAELKKDHEIHQAKLSSRLESLEHQFAHSNQELLKLGAAYADLQKQLDQPAGRIDFAEAAAAQLEIDQLQGTDHSEPQSEPEGMNIRSRYAELFELHEQGKSTDHIAKKLNMNKGEVNLILQLAKQEEQLNAQK